MWIHESVMQQRSQSCGGTESALDRRWVSLNGDGLFTWVEKTVNLWPDHSGAFHFWWFIFFSVMFSLLSIVSFMLHILSNRASVRLFLTLKGFKPELSVCAVCVKPYLMFSSWTAFSVQIKATWMSSLLTASSTEIWLTPCWVSKLLLLHKHQSGRWTGRKWADHLIRSWQYILL